MSGFGVAGSDQGVHQGRVTRRVGPAALQDVLGLDGFQVSPRQRATPTEQAVGLAQPGAV